MRVTARSCIFFLLLVACSTSTSTSPAPSSPIDGGGAQADDNDASSPRTDAAASTHAAPLALASCAAAPPPDASSLDITALVAHINRLPRPLDIPCFVATLPRPLSIVATTSRSSAQPAASAKSPRIFLMFPKLVVSVVPEGDGSPLAELGEWATTTRTIKGEIKFPIQQIAITSEEPFLHIEQSTKTTTCSSCHRDEVPHDKLAHAYVSAAFRPVAAPVTVADLEAEHQACTSTADATPRCTFFHALFDFGATTAGTFAREVDTF